MHTAVNGPAWAMEAGEPRRLVPAALRTRASSDSDGTQTRRRPRRSRVPPVDSRSATASDHVPGSSVSPDAARRKAARLLQAIRGYVPGQYRHGRSKFRRRRTAASRRSVSRVTFVGEFGAGKSSVINTLLHVVSGAPPEEFAEAALTGGEPRAPCVSPWHLVLIRQVSGSEAVVTRGCLLPALHVAGRA